METLAQNKVADNLEIKGAIEKVLLSHPRRGPIDFMVDVFKALKARFDMEKVRCMGNLLLPVQSLWNCVYFYYTWLLFCWWFVIFSIVGFIEVSSISWFHGSIVHGVCAIFLRKFG